MIKFFRRIRQRLLTENNFSKYMLYAVGEIVLVVIGILIALQINNWNQNRLRGIEEKNYYQNIKRQLDEDKTVIVSTVNYNNTYLEQFGYAIGIIENNDRTEIDTLARITMNLMKTSDFHRESNIYQSLVNSGEIKLLKNQLIIEGLQQLEETYIYLNKLEDTHSEAVMNFIVPNIVSSIKVNNLTVTDEDKLYTFEYQNQFALFIGLMNEKKDIYKRALDRIDELDNLIDEELNLELNVE